MSKSEPGTSREPSLDEADFLGEPSHEEASPPPPPLSLSVIAARNLFRRTPPSDPQPEPQPKLKIFLEPEPGVDPEIDLETEPWIELESEPEIGPAPTALPVPGVYLDPSEFGRLRLDVGDRRLVALAGFAGAGRIVLLTTDVAEAELSRRIEIDARAAREALTAPRLALLRGIDDERLEVLRSPPALTELIARLKARFADYAGGAQRTLLEVADVNPRDVFADYFAHRPPFDNVKRKAEFPDAFSLHRLRQWAKQNGRLVYVVGPNVDLARFCARTPGFTYFGRSEELLHHLNHGGPLAFALRYFERQVGLRIDEFFHRRFTDLTLVLAGHEDANVFAFEIQTVDIDELHALHEAGGRLEAEATLTVYFQARFTYEDYEHGVYDADADHWLLLDTVSGEIEDMAVVSVRFVFSTDDAGLPVVENIAFIGDILTIGESGGEPTI